MNSFSDSSSNPFVGLRPFESDEAVLFFGRSEQTTELLARLHRTHFLAVVGSSGCGKSSLVRAGLIPKLKAGMLVGDCDRWFIATMKPGNHPRRNMVAALMAALHEAGPGVDDGKFEERIQASGVQGIAEVLTQVLQQADMNLLLLVDQFEEIFRFTLGTGSAARKEEDADFVSLMLALAEQQVLPAYVVITMRSDFLGDCDAFYGLPEALNHSQYLVPRLSRKQRREAIEGPVRLYGQTVEPRLIDRILNDMGDESDQLPVMQHALMRVWNHWQHHPDGPLDLADYEAVGTVKKALLSHAEEALEGMDQNELKLTEKMFKALTGTDQTNRRIRRPAHLSKIETVTGATGDKITAIIERFRCGGRCFLVVSEDRLSGDFLVDISHESLIRQWERLSKWVDQEAADASKYKRIVDAALRHKKKEGALWQDPDLQLALDWWDQARPTGPWVERYGGEFDEAVSFLEHSKREKEERSAEARARELLQRKKRRRRIALLGALIALFGVLGGAILFQYAEAERTKARLAEALIAKQKEAQRTDLSGALTAFATSYGQQALEREGRGVFTSSLEKNLFAEYISVSQAIGRVQSEILSKSESKQRAEILSSMNGEVFLNPKNERRRFSALVAGWDVYEGKLQNLQGAVADAKSIDNQLKKAGYPSRFLANASAKEFKAALEQLLSEAEADCKKKSSDIERPRSNLRGVTRIEIDPCDNVLVFIYLSGHGFVRRGITYLVPGDVDVPSDLLASSDKVVSIEALRGKIAERVAAQIIIADISRGVWEEKN